MAYSDAILAETGLVSYWKLDETSGTSAADSKGSNGGTYTNGPTLNQAKGGIGMAGTAVAFAKASSQYVNVPDAASLRGLSGLTIECWVKFASMPATDDLFTLAGKVGCYYLVFRDEGGTKKFQLSGNATDTAVKVNWSPSTGVWYHVALTWQSGTNNTKVYVNGVEVGSGTQNTAMPSATNALTIGQFNGTFFLDGVLDNVALYNTALSAGTLLSHYTLGIAAGATDAATATDTASSSGGTTTVSASDSASVTDNSGAVAVPVPTAGAYGAAVIGASPLVYLKLDEASGTTAADARGNYNGTYAGAPTLGAAALVPNDQNGKAASFARASSQYITIGNQPAFGNLSGITVEAFVKFASLPASGDLFAIAGKNGSWYLTLFNNGGTYQLNAQGNFVDSPQRVAWTPTIGVTYHLVWTWSQANGTRFFIDGAQQGTSVAAASGPASATSAAVEFGRFNSTYYFDGTLDELAVYGTELSSGTIAAHFAAASAVNPASDSATATDASLGGTRYIGAARTGPVKLLTLGDSNTSGGYSGIAWSVWPTRVQSGVAAALPTQTVSLVNNAVGGTTSYDLLSAYATAIGDEQPSVVVLMHGTNDAWYDDPLGGYPRGDGADYSASAFQTRLATLVDNALGLTDASGHRTRVVLCTPPPAAVQADGTSLWRDSVRLSAMRDAVRAVAVAKGVRYVDPWGAIQAADPSGWKTTYLNDGVHLKSAGQQIVADLVQAAVLAELAAPVGDWGFASESAAMVPTIGLATLSASDSAAVAESSLAEAPALLTASDAAAADDAMVTLYTFTVGFDSAAVSEGSPSVAITIPPTTDRTLTALPVGASVMLYRIGDWRGSLLVKRHAGQAPPVQSVTVNDYGEAVFTGLLAGEYVAVIEQPSRRVFFQTGV